MSTTGWPRAAGQGQKTLELPDPDGRAVQYLKTSILRHQETYGLAKEGARHHGYTCKRGYHPLLDRRRQGFDVLMARLDGSGIPLRGVANFLRETVRRDTIGA